MKNTRKILVALCLTLVLVAAIAVSAAAAGTGTVKTGQYTNFEDYSSVNKVLLDDMEGGTNASQAATACGDHTKKKGVDTVYVASDGKGAPYIYAENGTTSSKSYVVCNYANKETGRLYIQPRFKNLSAVTAEETPTGGFVAEFDIAVLSGNLGEMPIEVFNSSGASDGCFKILSYKATDGTITVKSALDTSLSITSDKGKWIHITVLYDPSDDYVSVYGNKAAADRDGKIARTFLGRVKYDNTGVGVYPMQFRIGTQGATEGAFMVDNFLFYQSKSVCDPDYLSHFTEAQLFSKYVDLLSSTTATNVAKYETYELIRDTYLPQFAGSTDATAQAAVAKYNTFVSTKLATVTTEAKKENAVTFNNYVNTLKNRKRGLANISTREGDLKIIESFLAETASLIDSNGSTYETAYNNYTTWSGYLADDIDIRTFKNRMDRFTEAKNFNSSVAMQRHFEAAQEVASKIEAAHKANYANFGDTNEINALKTAYTNYGKAQADLATALKATNSERFIKLMGLLEGTTQADWEKDTGVMRNQWYLARDIILEGNYNSSVTGFAAAKTFYDTVDNYFWNKLQD